MDGFRPNLISAPLGYRARNMDGIWRPRLSCTTTPSPTCIKLLLPAAKRPTRFFEGNLEYDRRPSASDGAFPGGFESRTGVSGNSNAGHDFVTARAAGLERAAAGDERSLGDHRIFEDTIDLEILMANKNYYVSYSALIGNCGMAKGPAQVTDLSRSDLKLLHDQRIKPKSHTSLMNLDLHFDAGQAYGIQSGKKHRAAWQLSIAGRLSAARRGRCRNRGPHSAAHARPATNLSPTSTTVISICARGSPFVRDNTGLTERRISALRMRRKCFSKY